jgi:hypothetical protein
MKKIILLLIVSLLTFKTFSQTIQPAHSKDYYLQKSKKQKTTAWILLGGGTLMAVVGGISFSNNFDVFSSNSGTDASGFIFLGGVLADIASIPFFISAAHNKRTAAMIVLNHQNNYMIVQNRAILKTQPAISLQFRF